MSNEIFNQIYDAFKGNPIFNLISLLLAIGGIILTIYYYIKSKKNKIPTYIVRTVNLVKEKIQKIDIVEILYSGNKVNNLSITKVAIWNDGKDTIDSRDIAQNDLLRVTIKSEFEILDSSVLFHKNLSNDFQLIPSIDKKSVIIKFDFFDFEEGIVLQIFHTGNSSDDISVEGKVKSAKKIIRKEFTDSLLPSFSWWKSKDKSQISRKNMRKIIGWTMIFLAFFSLFLTIKSSFINDQEPVKTSENISINLKFFMLVPSFLYGVIGYRMIRKNIPKGFDIFIEEF